MSRRESRRAGLSADSSDFTTYEPQFQSLDYRG